MAKQVKYRTLKDDLDKVIASLQSDDIDVEEALELYKRGQALIKELEDYLRTAENTVKELQAKFDKQK